MVRIGSNGWVGIKDGVDRDRKRSEGTGRDRPGSDGMCVKDGMPDRHSPLLEEHHSKVPTDAH